MSVLLASTASLSLVCCLVAMMGAKGRDRSSKRNARRFGAGVRVV